MSRNSINSDSIIIIPARLAATRLPNKPLADICGISMIERVINQAIFSDIAPVYVATPDQDIFDIVNKTNSKAIITSDKHESGTDRIYEALEKIDPKKKIKYVINLQGDLPIINPDVIVKLANLIKYTDSDIATLATEISDRELVDDPNSVKIALCTNNQNALYFSRCPIPYNADKYYHHIGIYGYKRKSIERLVNLPQSSLEKIEKLEQLRALQNNMKIAVELVNEIPMSVDNAQDLEKVINFINSKNLLI